MPDTSPITLVLVSRNRQTQMRPVLSAIAANAPRPAEVLLADDASEDNTIAVFEQVCADLGLCGRVLRHDRGATDFRINSMRNAGLRNSKTDRVILLDADHVPATTHISAHMRMLDHGRKAMSYGPRMEAANADGTGPVNFMWGHEPYFAMSSSPDIPLPHWQLVAGSNLGLHRDFAEEVGMFDPQYDGSYGFDDVDFNFRASKCGAVFYGDFRAHVIHLPHETATGTRRGQKNAALFKQKTGSELRYPALVPKVTHPANWAVRYAQYLVDGSSGETPAAHSTPQLAENLPRAAVEELGSAQLIWLALRKIRQRLWSPRRASATKSASEHASCTKPADRSV